MLNIYKTLVLLAVAVFVALLLFLFLPPPFFSSSLQEELIKILFGVLVLVAVAIVLLEKSVSKMSVYSTASELLTVEYGRAAGGRVPRMFADVTIVEFMRPADDTTPLDSCLYCLVYFKSQKLQNRIHAEWRVNLFESVDIAGKKVVHFEGNMSQYLRLIKKTKVWKLDSHKVVFH